MKHSINDIINIMEQLDAKSGHNISKLPIKYKGAMNSLACCNFRKQLFKRVEYPESFYFSDQAMNMDDEDFKQTIIHEYAHAYVALESLKNGVEVEINHHGECFKEAVKFLGGWFICPTIEESYMEREREQKRKNILETIECEKYSNMISGRDKEIELLRDKPFTVYIIDKEIYTYRDDDVRSYYFIKNSNIIRTKTGKGRYQAIINNIEQYNEYYTCDNCVYIVNERHIDYRLKVDNNLK